mgnify:CR=1 FL=1|jgi:hypothetical protein
MRNTAVDLFFCYTANSMIHQTIKASPLYSRLRRLYEKHERLLVPGVLVLGVLFDFITFRTIKISSAFILLGFYALMAGAMIFFINYHDTHRTPRRGNGLRYLRLAAPLIVQFTFGALLSASLIFYWFSGVLSVSWPIILILVALMISNEALRHLYQKPIVQISVYFFTIFSYSTLIFPYLFNSISAWVFVFGGLTSLAALYGYVRLLARFLDGVEAQQKRITRSTIVIFIVMNTFYFLNLIPPIPLSLQEAGIYHNIEREDGAYILHAEVETFFERILPGETIHIQDKDFVYVYTSIFAPTDLDTVIYHQWQYYNPDTRDWEDRDRLSFAIFGGRDDGYRGYSVKSSVDEGLWRVNAETARGQVLGRIQFTVEDVEEARTLEQIVR